MELSALLPQIVQGLLAGPAERDCVEFKEHNFYHKTMAENISAIANALLLNDIPRGYIIWGVSDGVAADGRREIKGATYDPSSAKVGAEELALWLTKHLTTAPYFRFYNVGISGKTLVVLVIENPNHQIVKFDGVPFIRIGANTRRLADFPQSERSVWRAMEQYNYETSPAKINLFEQHIYDLLDLEAFQRLRRQHVPVASDMILQELIHCRLVTDNGDSTYNITNAGALLLAKDFTQFEGLTNKGVRTIVYSGTDKFTPIEDKIFHGGYAVSFENIHRTIMSKIQTGEVIDGALRKVVYAYPELSIRELLANTIVHQDLTNTGMQPTVEIFANRIEFTNPGAPKVDRLRFIDSPPYSRNMLTADELSKLGICERRGSGWDKVAAEADNFRCPAPRIEVSEHATKVILLKTQSYDKLTKDEQIWSVYIHACLNKETQKDTTNTSVRKRFGISESNSAIASRLIKQTLDKGLIVVFDVNSGTRNRKYLPFWAKNNTAQPQMLD